MKSFNKQTYKWIGLSIAFVALLITFVVALVMMYQPDTTVATQLMSVSSSIVNKNTPVWRIIVIFSGFFLGLVLISIAFELFQASQRRKIARKLSKEND